MEKKMGTKLEYLRMFEGELEDWIDSDMLHYVIGMLDTRSTIRREQKTE